MAETLSDVLTPDRLAALRELAWKYGVHDLRVFGSCARGEATPESDLDLLVDIDYGRGVAMRLVHFLPGGGEALRDEGGRRYRRRVGQAPPRADLPRSPADWMTDRESFISVGD